ncbi:MAG: hypothetical protein H6523_12945 [Mycolicibacterium sp.]|nr:hypothetical protein [Mycolicibacterium sp.]
MTTSSTPTAAAATEAPAWIAATAAICMPIVMLGLLISDGRPPTWLLAPAAALVAAGIAAMTRGWIAGPTPPRAAQPLRAPGLVGSRIVCDAGAFTVLDDSAVDGSGRRATVVAADPAGRVGLLFVGFDAATGRVAEAATQSRGWAAARVAG